MSEHVPFSVHTKKNRPFLGSSVKDGKIRYSSVSQIKLFDSREEGGCPRKWWFQYPGGKKEVAKTSAKTLGSDLGERLEHWLKTSEDVLPPLLQETKKFWPKPGPDLEVELPMAVDIEKAVFLRDSMLKNGGVPPENLLKEMERLAGLVANNVPLDGAPDLCHYRGEYVDENGVLGRELPGLVVGEIVDLKSTKRIDARKVVKGKQAGEVLPGYAKTVAQICNDPQMLGYAKSKTVRRPDLTHLRLGHIYAQKERKGAAKRTGLISVAEVVRRWQRYDITMSEMEVAAAAARPDDVPFNTDACDAYNYVDANGETQKGCMHRLYCPLPQAVAVQNLLGTKETGMSLLDQVFNPGDVPPSTAPLPPPLDDATHAALTEAERLKLLADDDEIEDDDTVLDFSDPNFHPLQGLDGYTVGQLCNGRGFYANSNGQGFIVVEKAHTCAGCAVPAPPLPIGQVNPPDSPKPTLFDAADPLPPEEIAKISDPALKAVAEKHAADHAARAAQVAEDKAAAKVKNGTGDIWCPGGKQRVVLTMEMALSRKMVCTHCGKTNALKPAKQADGTYEATIPRHKPVSDATVSDTSSASPVVVQAAPPPPAPPAVVQAAPPPPAPPAVVQAAPPPPAPPAVVQAAPPPPAVVQVAPPPPPAPPAPPAVVQAANGTPKVLAESAGDTRVRMLIEYIIQGVRLGLDSKESAFDRIASLVTKAA